MTASISDWIAGVKDYVTVWRLEVYADRDDTVPHLIALLDCRASTARGRAVFQRRTLKKYIQRYPDAYSIQLDLVQKENT